VRSRIEEGGHRATNRVGRSRNDAPSDHLEHVASPAWPLAEHVLHHHDVRLVAPTVLLRRGIRHVLGLVVFPERIEPGGSGGGGGRRQGGPDQCGALRWFFTKSTSTYASRFSRSEK